MSSTNDVSQYRTISKTNAMSPFMRLDSVWLHGAAMSGDSWDHITVSYPRAKTPELPGHGIAPLLAAPSVESFADAIACFVPPGAVIIGHSLGGMVALELAARPSINARALVLIEAVPTIRDRLTSRLAGIVVQGLFYAMPKSWLAWLTGIGESQQTNIELRRQIMRMNKAGIAAALSAAARYDGRPHLKEIQIPTLVIVGEKNTATHHGAALFAKSIRDAEFVKLPGGHMLHTDNPTQLKRCIENFLERTVPVET
ncbi:MAG: alpha/beta hydrolase [Pseudomonadota bacterium]